MTPEEIERLALNFYCSPYGKPNPQTYAFIKGYEIARIEKDAQIAELEKRLKELSKTIGDIL